MARKRDLENGDAPPQAIPVNLDGIPEELRGCAQWVLWRYESRRDRRGNVKWTKVPIRLDTRQHASSTDPATWTNFATILDYYPRKRNDWPGIGFNFHAEDPYCGVDLDDCRDSKSGALEAWAQEILLRLNSYAEVSPSGTGVKVILRGHVTGGRRRGKWSTGEFEVYDCGRFFAITGQHVEGTPTSVNDAQDALDAIVTEVFAEADEAAPPATPLTPPPLPVDIGDAQLIDRMFASHHGTQLRDLWHGILTAHEDDHSRADMALCSHLAWWCRGDTVRVDRLFRESGLYRKKWDEKRGDKTYGERTIERAMRGLGRGYDPQYRAAAIPAVAGATTAATATATAVTPTPTPTEAANPSPASPPVVPPTPAAQAGVVVARPHRLANFILMPGGEVNGRQVFVTRGLSAPEIAGPMFEATGNWPRRVGKTLFVPHPTEGVCWLSTSSDFFAWASRALGQGAMGNPIDWNQRGNDMLTKSEFFRGLASVATSYNSVEQYPHEPPLPNTYYCETQQAGGDGVALSRFLDFFTPATPLDRELLTAVLLTGVWGGLPGKRPAFAFVSESNNQAQGPGSGKTTMAELIASPWGQCYDIDTNESVGEIERRLLTDGVSYRFCLIDNIKNSRLSSAQIEKLITKAWISGRKMFVGEGGRPNYLTWMMTYNGVQMSADFASRSVIIQLSRPEVYGQWVVRVNQFVEQNRLAIMGDLIAMLRRPKTDFRGATRWAYWQEEVLSRVPHPAECQDLIRQRQGEANDDSDNAALVREEFLNVLLRNSHNPETCAVWFASKQAVAIASRASLGRNSACDSPTRLNALGIAEIQKRDRNKARGFVWVGINSTFKAGDTPLRFEPTHHSDLHLDPNRGTIPD